MQGQNLRNQTLTVETSMKIFHAIVGAVAMLSSTTAAIADPAIIYDMGGKFDKSFNEAAYTGAVRWAEETGGSFDDFEMQNEAQREQALRRFASRGSNPIVVTGFAFADAVPFVEALALREVRVQHRDLILHRGEAGFEALHGLWRERDFWDQHQRTFPLVERVLDCLEVDLCFP